MEPAVHVHLGNDGCVGCEAFNTTAQVPRRMPEGLPWYMAAWGMVDSALRRWSAALQRVLGLLRLTRVLLIIGLAAILTSGLAAALVAAGVISPSWFYALYAASAIFLAVPILILVLLVGLPLRARSLVRLVDMGYPENARELLIRVVARKLHDQSIETEELLFDTAVNEGRKLMRKMRKEDGADAAPPPPGAPPPPPPPPSPPGAPPA